MDTGELLTRWTVRLAFVLYASALGLRMNARGRWPLLRVARWVWTAGWVAFLVHVACAFQFYHHWSHAAAYEVTAQRTAEVTHMAWGGGLYANYAFILVWLIDVIWWWRGLEVYRNRRSWVEWSVQFFLGFMFFNATVVFGQGAIRWVAAGAGVALLVVWRWTRGSHLQSALSRSRFQ